MSRRDSKLLQSLVINARKCHVLDLKPKVSQEKAIVKVGLHMERKASQ